MNEKTTKYYLVLLFIIMSLFIYAQGSIKQPPLPKPDGPGPISQLPIDSGISILFFFGVVYGIYNKLKEK